MYRGELPSDLAAVCDAVTRCGGFQVRWFREGGRPREWAWVPEASEEKEERIDVVWTSAKLRNMLSGKKTNNGEDEEDDGRFLLGRRRQASAKSLVRGIEEHHDNPTSTRDVKRRAWPRTPWEAALGRLVEILDWKTVRSWKDKCQHEEHINVLEMRGKRRYINR